MTDPTKLYKKAIDFNKESFLTTFNTLSYLQKQTENIMVSMIDQTIWLPEESKKSFKEMAKAYKTGQEYIKANIENGYDKIESIVISNFKL